MLARAGLVKLWWRCRLWAVLALLLAACAGDTGVLTDDGGSAAPKGRTPPPVLLQSLTGLPEDRARIFKDALAAAAGRHDIGIVEGGGFQSGNYTLTGIFQNAGAGETFTLSYRFELRDEAGAVVETIAGSEPGGPAISPDMLQRIAEHAARQMAGRMAQLGFATRVGKLTMPPPYLYVRAGPGAQNEIDLETLHGPRAVQPVGVAPKIAAVPPPPDPAVAQSGKVEIRVVAVVAVEGSPGPGNRELTEAMRRTLQAAGWPVVAAPRADALIVRGKVALTNPASGSQKVSLVWAVETPAGRSLGDVRQANDVPAGSLDAGWGEAATAVAEAAAAGIFDIIDRHR
jgi:hypothetical protein